MLNNMDSEALTKMKAEFPGRETQINTLYQVLFQDDAASLMHTKLLLHGLPNTGKTAILLKLLDISSKFYVFVDCLECFPSNSIFQSILQTLSEKADEKKCDNFVDLVNCFKDMSPSEIDFDFLILKNCSTLENGSYIQPFIKLQEVLIRDGWNFPLIFIDHNTSAYGDSVRKDVARIFFPCYNRDELFEILPLLRPKYSQDIFQNFLRIFLPCVYFLYRDIFEILHLADVAFANYKKPIDTGKIQADNLQALYKNILPLINNQSFYLFPTSFLPDLPESMKHRENLEMGKVTKYLLVAAYIASFVSPKFDKQLFCKKSSKQKKKNPIPGSNNTANKVSTLLGPKQFSFNRLLYIFNALSGTRNYLTAELVGQVTTLVELQMIQCIGNDDGNIDQPRYKCIADFECVSAIAKTIDCELERYLLT